MKCQLLRPRVITLSIACCFVGLAGCGDDKSVGGAPAGNKASDQSPGTKKAGLARLDKPPNDRPARPKPEEMVAIPVPEDEDLPPAVMPKVVMSAEHFEAALVKVGQAMPEISLMTAAGTQQPLSALYGKQATVVFFWDSTSIYSQQELRDLDRDILRRYGSHGVAVIGINVGQSREAAQRAISAAGAKFPQRFDPHGTAMAKIATKCLPRTYLLDAKGNIVWFDNEYSTFTRRELRMAVRAVLGK